MRGDIAEKLDHALDEPNYHRALAFFLASEGFSLVLIPSLAVARTRESTYGLSWTA